MLVYLLEDRTSSGALVWKSHYAFSPRHAVRNAPLYHGVPYSRWRDDAKGLFVVASAAVVSSPELQRQAWALLRTLKIHGRLASDHQELALAIRYHLKTRGVITRSDRDMWSLMLIQWVRDTQPESYFSGSLDLGEAFLEELMSRPTELTLADRAARANLLEDLFGNTAEVLRMPGGAQNIGLVNLVASSEMVLRTIEHEEARAVAQLAVQIGNESLTRGFVMLAGVLPAATEIVVINIALEAFIGYIQFLGDLRDADKREIIESGEELDIWLSFAGILLPAASQIRYLGEALGIAQMLMLAASLLQALIAGLHRMLEATERLLAAVAAGFLEFFESDPDRVLFIPLKESV
jgi:hypothetical protein